LQIGILQDWDVPKKSCHSVLIITAFQEDQTVYW